MNASFGLVTELERLASALGSDSGEGTPISLQSVAERIAKTLGVNSDEVAILGLSTRWKHLHFLAPESLKNVGYIPLSSNSALAARTAGYNLPAGELMLKAGLQPAGVDTHFHYNHDLVKEAVTIFWYAALN